jgi:hypothetical protein
MSKYYDNGPYEIDQWNLLIRDVNDILQGPPEGSTNCDPIDPIDEVTDPHIWAIADVTEMRDKLKETCPDIDFSEELVLWKEAIIDEIEEQMEEAWCNCETEPEEIDIEICSFSQTAVKAGANDTLCCGYTEESAPCMASCIGDHCHETQYTGGWYPAPTNEGKYDAICDSYTAAYNATFSFISYMNNLPALGRKITTYQGRVDEYVSDIDALIEQYEDECLGESPMPGQCGGIAAEICSKGQSARSWQDRVDTEVENFAHWYDLAMPELATANGQAATNSAAAMSLEGRFPEDHNIFGECYADAIPSWSWYDFWDPATMDQLGDLMDWAYNRASDGDGALVRVHAHFANSNTPHYVWGVTIRLSPNGTPFLKGMNAKLLNRSYSKTYWEQKDRWRCETNCDPEPGDCQWNEWSETETWWWDQGWSSGSSCVGSCSGFCDWIWTPLPEPIWDDLGSDAFSLYTRKDGSLKDQSEKRDAWLAEYNNWYDEHEQYDDRHASYC